jgi:hypothetical protein
MNDPALDLNIELFANCLKATPINEGVAESNRRYFINRLKELLNCKPEHNQPLKQPSV